MIMALEQVECMERSYIMYQDQNTVDSKPERTSLKVRLLRPIQERMS
jgi:hypothetical protein